MDSKEYERRRAFSKELLLMSHSEQIEIVRILTQNDVPISENNGGILFDLAKLSQEVFDKLVDFQKFVITNNAELDKRDQILREPFPS